MKNPPYTIHVDPEFYEDVKKVSAWIKKSNLDFGYDEDFADSKVDDFKKEVLDLMDDLTTSPDQGQENEHSQVRGFPVYDGRYSVRWTVDDSNGRVNVLGIKDSKHIYQIRGYKADF